MSVEFCQAVVLTADEWTPESELVTVTRRIQRYDAEVLVLFFFFSISSSCCIVSSSLRTRVRLIVTNHSQEAFMERK